MRDNPAIASAVLVIPVFDDWPSLETLGRELSAVPIVNDLSVVVVDDGSILEVDRVSLQLAFAGVSSLLILHLQTNLGHQRAIAVGLSYALDEHLAEYVIVMDGDCEDRPEHVEVLLRETLDHPTNIVVAQRTRRHEGLRFRVSYRAFKSVFKGLTGRRLDFGNFSCMTLANVRKLIYGEALWNNFPAAVLAARVPITRVPLERGTRAHGRSRMAFPSLVSHGLGALSVFTDLIFARLLIVMSFVAVGLTLFASIAVGLRIASGSALPGWFALLASVAILGVAQSLTVVLVTSIVLLNARGQRRLGRLTGGDFIRSVDRIL